MTATSGSTNHSTVPSVPALLESFIPYLTAHPKSPTSELLEPYKKRDTKLRELFAQEPGHSALSDPHVNTVPVYAGHESELTIRARNPEAEATNETENYVMPLNDEDRKESGTPAVVESFKKFQNNFNVFSESSLVDLDWSNVVAAGSSVVTALLPVPGKYDTSKRALRQYYHEILAPASDVDLFLYGLEEEEAIEKIKQIETRVRDSILQETTTIRTKHAITIASQYPTRHVQIVLRIYKSVSEILTGFDVDSSCAAYDGTQVYAAPRALAAYMTQINTIDLSRRSPSYENRLSKYSHRGFEVYWPQLDRSRIDPTIFERNFGRTVGLARLLVLEKLPKSTDRDDYMDQRRRERGRPEINRSFRFSHQLRGNIKNYHEDEVAEWVEQDEVSDYHTFTVPYGEKFHAKKIEKLLYTKDLLLNAEWNKPKDREVHLHRHPAFFGYAEDVIGDCCGYCPKPVTPEEEEVAEEESKIYVSGPISFIKDDPGRQTIGSFNPITDDDWTEMAYVGNTARLCQAIVDGDLEHVQDWLAGEDADPNCRDYTGRTPLQLAALSSTAEIVQCLVDHGARLVARMADGRTALHLAAARGEVEMIRILLIRSEANEAEEAEKEDLRRKARAAEKKPIEIAKNDQNTPASESGSEEDGESDGSGELVDDEEDDADMQSATSGSYVKVKETQGKTEGDTLPEDADKDEPDFYDVNVLAWDTPCSALHLGIVNGHVDVVEELVQTFGADVLLPVKLLSSYDKSPRGAILTLVLALTLPLEKAKEMALALLKLGASSAQADLNQSTAFQYYVANSPEVLQVLFDEDGPAVKRVLNHLAVTGSRWNPTASNPLLTAIHTGDSSTVLKLLDAGAKPSLEFSDWMRSFKLAFEDRVNRDPEENRNKFSKSVEQPVVYALEQEEPSIIIDLLKRGADPNTLTKQGQSCLIDEYQRRYNHGESLLDVVQNKLEALRKYDGEESRQRRHYWYNSPSQQPLRLKEDAHYLGEFKEGTYKYWMAKSDLKAAKKRYQEDLKRYNEEQEEAKKQKGTQEKKDAILKLIKELERVEEELLQRGAKKFVELYPDLEQPQDGRNNNYYHSHDPSKLQPFEVKFSFQVSDLTPVMKEAYLNIFEAAWSGDLETIKEYTLSPWGSNKDENPLEIAATDSCSASLFSIAVLRGHRDVAKAILDIAQAQYAPKESNTRERYNMRQQDSDSEYHSEGEDSDDHQLRIYKDIVDDRFTIDNIGEVATQVKSQVKPQDMIGWSAPISRFKEDETKPSAIVSEVYSLKLQAEERRLKTEDTGRSATSLFGLAIWNDDLGLLTWLLNLHEKYSAQTTDKQNPALRMDLDGIFQFDLAIKLGRTTLLAELMKRTGAGIPLEDLVKKSGVEVKEKPKFYQGLTVHGRKRDDWAAAGRGTQMVADNTCKNPPLLIAAFAGALESIEWFLSDAPKRRYIEFAEANKDDMRLKNLAKAAGGYDKAILSWLNTRADLSLHCAVLSKPNPDTVPIVKYLIEVAPSSLKMKSSEGYTPLHLAFSLHRISLVRVLIDAGAEQTCRDYTGNNIIHSILHPSRGSARTKTDGIRELLDLIDPRLLSSLFTERCSENPGAVTPLHLWLSGVSESDDTVAVLKLILEYSKGEELSMINGAGDTPLHSVVASRQPMFMKAMLDCKPELLYRENATGRTPAEVAYDQHIAGKFTDPPTLQRNGHQDILDRSPETFIKEDAEDGSQKQSFTEAWQEAIEKIQGKRKLVSLFEANEVAKRLAGRETEKRKIRDEDDEEDLDEDAQQESQDEVSEWYGIAVGWKEFVDKDVK